jgi:hypothetical protein
MKLGLRRPCPLAWPVTVKAAAMAAAEPRKFRRFILWPFIPRLSRSYVRFAPKAVIRVAANSSRRQFNFTPSSLHNQANPLDAALDR